MSNQYQTAQLRELDALHHLHPFTNHKSLREGGARVMVRLAVTRFKEPDEAIRLANGTVYGLAAGLWTRDVSRAHHAAREIKAGLIWVNGWDACEITMPFGGFKQSGFGRDRSLHALHKYADLKSVSFTIR